MTNRRQSSQSIDPAWVVRGMVLGLLVGGLVTLLTAPISGKPLRRRIQERMMSARDEFGGTLRDAMPVDRVDASLEDGKAAARRLMDGNGRN